MKVFLGGTCNGSTWRDDLIPMLKCDYFNPVVENWTPECQEVEINQRQISDFVLYTITKEMKGVYSIAEAVDDSNKRPEKTILCLILDGFDEAQTKSLNAVGKMANENGAHVCLSLNAIADFLNTRAATASAA
jgi:Nucleoside 2-deoxyribosyltransferase like